MRTRPALTPRPWATLCAVGTEQNITSSGGSPAADQGVPVTALLYAGHVANNPLKYIDPTGHMYLSEPHSGPCIDGNANCAAISDSANYTGESAAYFYATANNLPLSVIQVDLGTFSAFNQYEDDIVWKNKIFGIKNYGWNSCGLAFLAGSTGFDIDYFGELAKKKGYTPDHGIQPSALTEVAAEKLLGNYEVIDENNWTILGLYQALLEGDIVGVDIKVANVAGKYKPASGGNNFAHFARVLGVDAAAGEIYIENTLPNDLDNLSNWEQVWTLTIHEFYEVWQYPENSVPLENQAPSPEGVTQWGLRLIGK